MIKNYLKVGFRSLRRNKLYSGLNIFGLALGLAAFFLILVFVSDELSYDKHFKDSETIYRVVLDGVIAGNAITLPTTPSLLAETMQDEYPEVRQTVRMRGPTLGSDPITVEVGDQFYNESRVIYADSTFFDFFGIDLIAGNPQDALASPNSVVLTPEIAMKYFGNENPVGKSIRLMDLDQEFRVTGVAKPLPRNTHFHYDILASLVTDRRSRSTQWLGGFLMTYVKLGHRDQKETVNTKFDTLVRDKVVPQIENFMGITFTEFQNQGGEYRYYLQEAGDIHLDSNLDTEWEAKGNRTYVNILSVVGVIILLLAGINFTNLATSQAAGRAKEIGMRKVLGSQKKQLITQFLTESMIISILGTMIAFVVIQLVLPSFNNIVGRTFTFSDITAPEILVFFIFVTVLLGIASGIYPALYLSGFSPKQAVSDKISMGKRGLRFRNILVTFQFIISTSLVISTLVIGNQLDYIQTKELGFDKEQIIVIRNADVLGENTDAFRNELNQKPGILSASFSTSIPGRGIGRAAYQPENSGETLVLPLMSVDHEFLDVYKIPVVEGRAFPEERTQDAIGVILNTNAVQNIGFDDPIGKVFNAEMEGAEPLQVIGVIDDFHFQSLHRPIQPLILEYIRPTDALNFLSVKISGENVPQSIATLEQTWKEFAPRYTFKYEFFDSSYESLYQNDEKLGFLIKVFAVIAIVIACLGLFGLMTYTTHTRKKEVGIRKVLGSSTTGIVVLYLKNTALLITISVLISCPVSYLLVKNWLQNFAYQVSLTPGPFLLGSLVTLLIALGSVSYIVLRAASVNPASVIHNN